MKIIRSDKLAELVATENLLRNEYPDLCDPTIEDVACKDYKLTDIILKIIEDNGFQTKLIPGNCISITDDTINLNVGQGLKNDGLNNVAIDYSTILTPKDGTCIDVNNDGNINLNIGNGLKNNSNSVAIDFGAQPLVSPSLLSVINEYKYDKSILLRTLTSNPAIVEDGALIDVDSKFKYTLNGSYSEPITISGDYGSVIPPDNTYSSSLLINNYLINTGNLTKSVNFVRPKSGLNVENNKVVAPVGNDTTTASLTVSINYPFYLGYSATTPTSISGFSKRLNIKSGSLTYTGVTATTLQYTYFLFPNDVTITGIIMDGAAPILSAFTQLSNVNIITDTGVTRSMKVLKSNALGAFNNNTLRFDFHN